LTISSMPQKELRWFIPLLALVLALLAPLGYGVGGESAVGPTILAAVIVGGGQILSGRSAAQRNELTWKRVFSASVFSALLGGLIKGVSGNAENALHYSVIDGFLLAFMLTFNAGILFGRTSKGWAHARTLGLQVAIAGVAVVQGSPRAYSNLLYYIGGITL